MPISRTMRTPVAVADAQALADARAVADAEAVTDARSGAARDSRLDLAPHPRPAGPGA